MKTWKHHYKVTDKGIYIIEEHLITDDKNK